MVHAKVIEDSVSCNGIRITTLQVKFHRFILPEFNTHRVFSRNFSSSRAIPTKKLLEQIRKDPAMPVHWGKNQAGMQAKQELDLAEIEQAKQQWLAAAQSAADYAEGLANVGVHKQIVNRVIEPFLWANGIVTSTEWDNWFDLRAHEDAQPEIYALATAMKQAMDDSVPQKLDDGEWHLPYIFPHERNDSYFQQVKNRDLLLKISAARCCRVSYLKHDGAMPNVDDDLALFDRLAGAVPLHASPLEHQATPDAEITADNNKIVWAQPHLHGNLNGWIQYRKVWEQTIYISSK